MKKIALMMLAAMLLVSCGASKKWLPSLLQPISSRVRIFLMLRTCFVLGPWVCLTPK